jgi:hypothetical protein
LTRSLPIQFMLHSVVHKINQINKWRKWRKRRLLKSFGSLARSMLQAGLLPHCNADMDPRVQQERKPTLVLDGWN